MAAVPFVNTWNLEDNSWLFNGSVSVAGGVLTANGDVKPTSFQPDYSSYVFNNRIQQFVFVCFEQTVEIGDTLRIALGANEKHIAVYPKCFEVFKDVDRLRIVSRVATLAGFDSSLFVMGSSIKIRIAVGNHPGSGNIFRVAFFDMSDNVVVDTGFLAKSFFNHIVPIPEWIDVQAEQNNYGTDTVTNVKPVWLVPSGTAIFQPFSGWCKCQQSEVDEFMATGQIAVGTSSWDAAVPVPEAPVITVTNYHTNLNRVSITCATELSNLFVTVDEGGWDEEPSFSKRSVERRSGTYSFTLRKQAVVRAQAVYANVKSAVTTQYVGAASPVAIPEISPSCEISNALCDLLVTCKCSDPAAEIRYTLDGGDPTLASALYTEPLAFKYPSRLRVRSFKAGQQSPMKQGLYANSWMPIRSDIDTTVGDDWLYSGNATFSAGGMTVNDPTGIGVALREDLNGSGKLMVISTRFRSSGPFRLKMPGEDRHLAWVGNAIGIVADTAATPGTAFVGQAYADVRITTTIDGNESNPRYLAEITVRGDTVTATFSLNFANTYNSSALVFTGEGISSYLISDVEVFAGPIENSTLFMSAASPILISDYPTVLPVGKNIAGQTITVTGSGTTSLSHSGRMVGEVDYASGVGDSPLATDTFAHVVAIGKNVESGKLPAYQHKFFRGSEISLPVLYWNTKKTWGDCAQSNDIYRPYESDIFKVSPDLIQRGVAGTYSAYAPADLGTIGRKWHKIEFVYPEDEFDIGNAWYEAGLMFQRAMSDYPIDFGEYNITCGFDTDKSIPMPVHENSRKSGFPGLLWTKMTNETSDTVQLRDLTTFEPTSEATYILGSRPTVRQPYWRCGRRISGGNVFVRVMLIGLWKVTDREYDSGWINCGAVGGSLPRPRIIMRFRDTGAYGSLMLKGQWIRGFSDITETELENCFTHGLKEVVAAPTISIGGTIAGGMVDVTLTAPGADKIIVTNSKLSMRRRSSTAYGKWQEIQSYEAVVNSGDVVSMPSPSYIRAVALKKPYQAKYDDQSSVSTMYHGVSLEATASATRPATDFIEVSTIRPRLCSVRIKDAVNTFSGTEDYYGSIIDHYKLVFSDGFEHRFKVRGRDFERYMLPGNHSVKVVRCKLNGNASEVDLGETTSIAFSISDSASAVVTSPTTINLGVPGNFSIAMSGGAGSWTYAWEFSDGTQYATASFAKTMSKPGKYRFTVTATDASGQSSMDFGEFLVPYSAAAVENMTKSIETRVS